MMARLLLIMLIIMVAQPAPIRAQVAAIAAAASIESIIAQIRNSLSSVISEAESSATVTGFSIAADANILISNLGIIAGELEGKTFRDLNATQQAIFANMLQVSTEAARGMGKPVKEMHSIVRTLGAELSRLPGVSNRPFVSAYAPVYAVANNVARDVTIEGSLLAKTGAVLSFDTLTCRLAAATEQRLTFVCPEALFAPGRASWISGTLSLPEQTGTIVHKKVNYNYKIGIKIIPKRLGTYVLAVTELHPQVRRVHRREENSFTNDHCADNREKVWSYRPESKCAIDVQSIRVNHQKSQDTQFEGTINVSPSGFQVRGNVRNHGHCLLGIRNARGSLRVQAEWDDECPQAPRSVALEPQSGEINWGEERAFRLSGAAASFTLTVTQADGSRKVITATTSAGWFTATYDPATKILVLKPRDVGEAMQ